MALKKTIETEYHIPAEYEDIFNATLSHSDGKTFVAATMRGWQKKAYCRSSGKEIWAKTFRIEPTAEEKQKLFALYYDIIKSHVPELADAEPVYDVDTVTMDKTELSLAVGDTAQLTAVCTPDTAEDLTVTWTSSDESIATVDGTGLVTAVASGTAVITATSNDESSVTATCTVTVAVA